MIDSQRWHHFTLFEQMAHLGAEITRARLAQDQADQAKVRQCLERAFDLIDLTKSDLRLRGRLKEICRMRELAGDHYLPSHIYNVPLASLEEYCLQFALAARKGR